MMRAAIPLAVIWTVCTGLGPVETVITKIPGGTMVEGTSTTVMDISFERFATMMCAYHLAGEISDEDVILLQLPVTDGAASQLMADTDRELDEVDAFARANVGDANCPGGQSYVVGIIDFPWPLRDAWQVSLFTSTLTEGTALIDYQFQAGTARESSGHWQMTATDDGRTAMKAYFRFDVGFRIPEFLIRWGVNRTFPDLFADMEVFAEQLAAANE